MKKTVTFGEIMMRLKPPGFQRFGQAHSFEVSFGGGEANVAASLTQFGVPVEFVTRLPQNDLGDACLNFLRQYGVGIQHIIRGGDRLGIYFLETGAAQRGSKVIYDRADSAIANIQKGMIDWNTVLADAGWFHFTGITPAISASAAEVCLEAARTAKDMGLTVSCDLNYRAKLWRWGKPASDVMPELVRQCEVVVGNEEDAEKVLGIAAPGVDITSGNVPAEAYGEVCENIVTAFPMVKIVAITLRGSHSASHNTWTAVLYKDGKVYAGPVFEIDPIVDRIGGGDSFVGGLIYGLLTYGDEQTALNFAVAASCLKHSIPGDFNFVQVGQVEKLLEGDASGRVSR